jgi:hypothetical protein
MLHYALHKRLSQNCVSLFLVTSSSPETNYTDLIFSGTFLAASCQKQATDVSEKPEYLQHQSPPPATILTSLRSNLILFSHLLLGLSSYHFLDGFPTKILYATRASPMWTALKCPKFHYFNLDWARTFM